MALRQHLSILHPPSPPTRPPAIIDRWLSWGTLLCDTSGRSHAGRPSEQYTDGGVRLGSTWHGRMAVQGCKLCPNAFGGASPSLRILAASQASDGLTLCPTSDRELEKAGPLHSQAGMGCRPRLRLWAENKGRKGSHSLGSSDSLAGVPSHMSWDTWDLTALLSSPWSKAEL